LPFFIDLQASRPAKPHSPFLARLHAALIPLANHFPLEFGERAEHRQH